MAFTEREKRACEQVVSEFIEARRPAEKIRDELDLGFRIKDQGVEIFEISPGFLNPEEKSRGR